LGGLVLVKAVSYQLSAISKTNHNKVAMLGVFCFLAWLMADSRWLIADRQVAVPAKIGS